MPSEATGPDLAGNGRLRVLQISHDYEGPFRSICRQFANAFSGHDVTTVYVCGKADAEVEANSASDRVIFLEQSNRAMRGIKLGTLFRIAALFRKQHFDIVIAHRYRPIYFAGVMSYFFRIPVTLAVIHEHNVFRRLSRRLFITFWCPDIICIGVSDSVSRDIERACGPLLARGRLYTLPNALDIAIEKDMLDGPAAREHLGLPAEGFCFGTVGRLVDKKDYDILLQAFARYCNDSAPEAMLAIVGGGPEALRLQALARDLGIETRVHFTGHVAAAYRYIRAFDVFVMASGAREAFGVVLLEAMLARLPIISSDAPGPAEVVGDTALLFASGRADELAGRLVEARGMETAALAELANAGHDRLLQNYTLDAFRDRIQALPAIRAVAGE